jgi:DNA polymerase
MTSIDQLKCDMAVCTACDLAKYRSQIVFGDGVLNPAALIIGEAPGEDEDLQGLPFVGKAGQQLNKMLAYAGLDRKTNAYIANTVLCRPPNNRTPLVVEMDACRARLHKQINLVNPKFLIILGKSAMTTMLGQEFKGPLKQFFTPTGNLLEFVVEGKIYQGICCYHPSYHLRNRKRAYHETLPIWNRVRDMVKI